MAVADRKIWRDGALVPWADATVHVLSQSIQRGTLVFDVMPVYWLARGPAILGLAEHVERFLQSAELSGMPVPYTATQLHAAIAETVRANPGAEVVKISGYWPGVSLDVLPVDAEPGIAIAAFAIADISKTGRASAGGPARLQIAESKKMPSCVLPPQVKIAAAYTHSAFAKARAKKAGFHDVLFLDERGSLTESSAQSFFLVCEGILRSAPLDVVLAGVTRRLALELARDEGIPVKEEPMPRELLARAEEAFLTGTTSNVWPIERVDAVLLPPPIPGPITRRLVERFAKVVSDADPVFSRRWLQGI
jgi:branched-chain amino acid aminotransferase